MISELEALAVLHAIADARDKLGPDEVRAAALVASLFSGRLVRHDVMQDFILGLAKKGLLEGEGEELRLTVEGKALLDALGEKRIGTSRLKTLDELAKNVRGAASTQAFIEEFGPRVTELVRAQKTKLSAPPGDIVLCAMIIQIEGVGDLHRSAFALPSEHRADDANPWRAIYETQADLVEELGVPVHATVEGEHIVVVAPQALLSIPFDGRVLKRPAGEKLPVDAHGPYLSRATEGFFAQRLTEAGYSPVGSVRRVFVRYAERGIAAEGAVPAVRLFYQALGPPYVLVWVEEFTKPWTRALDLLAGAKDKEEMQRRLGGLRFRTLPYERPATLVDILSNVDLAKERVAGTGVSYMNHWAELDYDLEEPVQALLVMQTKTGRYHYPAETVLVRAEAPDLMELREPAVLTPEERHEGLEDVSRQVFHSDVVDWMGLRFSLKSVGPTLNDVPAPWTPRAALINPPLLRFAGGKYGSDPMDIFTTGAEAGRKPTFIRRIFHPPELDAADCRRAVEVLCKHYESKGFGRAGLSPDMETLTFPAEASSAEIGTLMRRIVKAKDPEAVGILFLAEGDPAYYAFKRFHPEYVGAPIQAVQTDTLPTILSRKRGVLDQLVLNLYLKRLGPRESAWTLASPAGGSEKTSFLAIAFSRRLDPRKAGRGVAALHDAVGRGLSWNALVTPGERTITEAWFGGVLDQVHPLLEGEPSDRLVIYRTGRLDPVEIEAIRRSLTERASSLPRAVDFVAVFNEHRRFFVRSDGGLRNPPPGTVIFWSEDEALLAASGFAERGIWRGTVVPVGLTRVIGTSKIDSISAEYHDLTHLSWSAPSTTWKHPLVLKIAERLAEAAREGVPSGVIQHLPL